MTGVAEPNADDARTRLRDLPEPLLFWRFPVWKHRHLRRCYPQRQLRFVTRAEDLGQQGTLVLWGMQERPAGSNPLLPILRMEDGFLRSVGLGAELTRPLSWVADRSGGLYYTTQTGSDLETLLLEHPFPAPLLARAAALRQRLVAARVSKYNVGHQEWQRPAAARAVVLVLGQVESDAAVRLGAPQCASNLQLLQAARAAHPHAYLLYKPHPDVLAGLRRQGVGEEQALAIADELIGEVAIDRLLDQVDRVHVLSSLAGFEALLRGVPVTCHGLPFYAGWGLTDDRVTPPRPHRTLSIDALVAAVLILYPLYFVDASPAGQSPEAALTALESWRRRQAGRRPAWWRGIYRALLRRFIGVY